MSTTNKDWEELERGYYGRNSDVIRVKTYDGSYIALKYIQLSGQDPSGSEAKLNHLLDVGERLRKMEHRNLVNVIEVRLMFAECQIALFMELIVDGKSLESFISSQWHENRTGLLEADIRDFIAQTCSALAYLHSQRVIHRNISSSNVIICTDKTVKLIDFGVSVQLDGESSHQTGCIRGFPNYMAPELLDSGEQQPEARMADTDTVESASTDTVATAGDAKIKYGCPSDIWAMGCLLYEMAVGQRPYADCRNMNAMVRRIVREGAPEMPEGFSIELKSFYSLCVLRNKRERATAEELLRHKFLPGN